MTSPTLIRVYSTEIVQIPTGNGSRSHPHELSSAVPSKRVKPLFAAEHPVEMSNAADAELPRVRLPSNFSTLAQAEVL